MRCRRCKRDIEDDSLFCKFCGEKLIRERRKKSQLPKDIRKLSDGSLSGKVMIKGQRLRIHAKTESEFTAMMDAYRHGWLQLPNAGKSGMTVADAISDYAERRKNRLKPSTLQNYEYIRDNRFPDLYPKTTQGSS